MAKIISQLPSGGSSPRHNNLLGLNEGDYIHLTELEKNKLDNIQPGAEVNVNTDWNATSGDAQLLNKPTSFPPSTHTHTISDVDNLQNELDNKASILHATTHEVTGSDPINGENLSVNVLPPTANYIPFSPTLKGHLQGIDSALGDVVQTTAGITSRVFFTGDLITLGTGNYYLSNYGGKGTVAGVSPAPLINDDNQKKYFTQDVISIPFSVPVVAPAGAYSGNLSVRINNDNAQQQYTIEVYRTALDGTPLDSGVIDAPIGDLGVKVVSILSSGNLNLVGGDVSSINLTGYLTQEITFNVNERLRYRISAEKVGTAGGNITMEVFYGSNYNSFYDVPVIADTNSVLNRSNVIGTTTTNALDTLNAGKMDKSVYDSTNSGIVDASESIQRKVFAQEAISKGDPVYVSSTGDPTFVMRARADNAAKMPAIGVAAANIASGTVGTIIVSGSLRNINTGSYTLGKLFYVGATGGITSTKPSVNVQSLGIVARTGGSDGVIVVEPQAVIDLAISDISGLQPALNNKISTTGNETKVGELTIQTTGADLEKKSLIIVNPLDEDFRQAITIKAGSTANQRRYFQYLNHLGVRTNLMGFNAQNGFIAYNSIDNYHYISSTAGQETAINSKGTFQVTVNKDENATGTNGMAIYDGTATPTASNIMYNLSSTGIYANSGRFFQAQSPDNLQFNKLFSTNGSAYLQSSLALRLYNSGNIFNFADSGLVDRIRFDLSNTSAKVSIGTTSPDAWNRIYSPITLGNYGGNIYGRENNSEVGLISNSYRDASSNWVYKISGAEASQYYMQAGEHFFNTAITGTAGATVSWSTRAKITNTGRFLLGTTTDNLTDNLQVNGSAIATAWKTSGGTTAQFVDGTGALQNKSQFQTALTNPVTGTGVSGRVAFWNGTNSQTSDSELFWDNTLKSLGIGVNPTSGTKLQINGKTILSDNITIGSGLSNQAIIAINKSLTGSTSPIGINIQNTILSDATSNPILFRSLPSTEAATFNINAITHFNAVQGTFGAGSTVGTQYGFLVSSTLVGATNNYAFASFVPAGANRYNLYMGGTANNYLAGRLLLGTTTDNLTDIAQFNGSAIATQYKLSALNTAPATATSTGTTGEIRVTATHIYVCTATNTWVRTALTTW